MFAPASVHVPVGAVWAAPFASVSVTSTCSPAAGDEAVAVADVLHQRDRERVRLRRPGSSRLGVIAIFAFTHRLRRRAGVRADAVRVPRQRDAADRHVVCALTVVTPVTAERQVIVQQPVPPAVVHGFARRERARAASRS